PAPAEAPARLPDGLFLPSAPEGAKGVRDAKAEAGVGRDLVIHGRIGGRREPFTKGSAVFLLADRALPACGEANPNDGCKTPWDYCCEPADVIAANTATIQIVGADGRPLAISLRGVHDLAPMAEVVVVGKVAQRSDDGVLVVNATGLYVRKAGS
ncbi:MAG: hypothetical protein HUU27_12355, partial [Phycisphaerae bacterium]|nr:hypothetical protein [Phycisphaerae bacterium]